MNPEWLCYVNGQEYGPYTWPQLVQMAAAGNVVPETHVRRTSDTQWYTAEQIPGLFGPATPAPIPTAPAAIAPAPVAAVSPVAVVNPVPTGKAVARKTSVQTTAAQPDAAQPGSAQPSATQPTTSHAAAKTPAAGIPRSKSVTKSSPSTTAPTASRKAAETTSVPAVSGGSGGFSIQTSSSLAKGRADEKSGGISGRGKSTAQDSKTMLFVLGGLLGVVCILGVVLLVWALNGFAPSDSKATARADVPVEEAPVAVEPEAPVAEAPPAKTEVKPAEPPPPVEAPKVDPREENKAILKSVGKFTSADAFTPRGVRNGLIIEKVRAWLASDEAGTPASPLPRPKEPEKEPGSEGLPAGLARSLGDLIPSGPPPLPKPKYVFVELSIKNTAQKPLPYAGWNAMDSAAVLVDEQSDALPLTPIDTTPQAKRKSAMELAAGESLSDTVVFTMNEPYDSAFSLVLPGKALSKQIRVNFGVVISPQSLVVRDPEGYMPRAEGSIPIPGLHDEPLGPNAGMRPAGAVRNAIPGLGDDEMNTPKPAGMNKPETMDKPDTMKKSDAPAMDAKPATPTPK